MVKIGNCYIARLTKTEMPVRIESQNTNGTWRARSLTHGRIVFVKNESQIVRECNDSDLVKFAKTVMPNRRSRKQTPVQKLPVETPIATPHRKPIKKQPCVPEFAMTALDAAYRVLKESKKPLTSQEIVDLAFKRKYARSNGVTPANTVNSAMIREINAKGNMSRFIKVGRGLFVAR